MSTPDSADKDAALLLRDTARLAGQSFACRYDRISGNVYTYEPLGFVMGDVLDLPDRRLLITSMERAGGVTRIRTRVIPSEGSGS